MLALPGHEWFTKRSQETKSRALKDDAQGGAEQKKHPKPGVARLHI